MTTAGADDRLQAAQAFVRRVRALGSGELAALKRNAGRPLTEARGVMWFHRLLDRQHGWHPAVLFLVATLMSLNGRDGSGDFGESMRRLALVHGEEAVERRFRLLLDSQFSLAGRSGRDGGELAHRLRQLVRLAASKGIGIDWARLLVELRQWTHPEKRVQRRWAESFYAREEGARERGA